MTRLALVLFAWSLACGAVPSVPSVPPLSRETSYGWHNCASGGECREGWACVRGGGCEWCGVQDGVTTRCDNGLDAWEP